MCVKSVNNLAERSLSNSTGVARIRKDGVTIYKTVFANGQLSLYHCGTLILTLDNVKDKWFVPYVGGYSLSDQNAINSIFELFNIPFYVTRKSKRIQLTNKNRTKEAV